MSRHKRSVAASFSVISTDISLFVIIVLLDPTTINAPFFSQEVVPYYSKPASSFNIVLKFIGVGGRSLDYNARY